MKCSNMIILTFLFIISGIIIWNLYYKPTKKNENFNCSTTTPSMTKSGERIYFINELLNGHYDKSALYNKLAVLIISVSSNNFTLTSDLVISGDSSISTPFNNFKFALIIK